jgi:secernin
MKHQHKAYSCDTFLAQGSSTKSGRMIFAKNSDRYMGEAANVVYFPAADHPSGTQLKISQHQIPQVGHTYALLGLQPHYIWGLEIGVNEFGVSIGNEAEHSFVPPDIEGILGMDLVRLGLERGRTAEEALNVITALIDQYSEGGVCSPDGPGADYNNTFIIADGKEAWVLETLRNQWVAKRIKDPYYSISNTYWIEDDYDKCSNGIPELAQKYGLPIREGRFNFAKTFALKTTGTDSFCITRRMRAMEVMKRGAGQIDVPYFIQMMRDHYEDNEVLKPRYDAANAVYMCLCFHGEPGIDFQTNSSLIVDYQGIDENGKIKFAMWIGLNLPCCSTFFPIFALDEIPAILNGAGGTYDPDHLWWQFERMKLGIEANYNKYIELWRPYQRYFDGKSALLATEVTLQNPGKKERMARLTALLDEIKAACVNVYTQIETDLAAGAPVEEHRALYLESLRQKYMA